MKRQGYSGRLSTASLAAGGTLGILIPPSVPLVVYAILTEQNIGKLFAAAMIPGLLAMLGYVVVIGLYCKLQPGLAPSNQPLPWSQRWQALWGIWPIMAIFSDRLRWHLLRAVFSPTEGAAVGAVADAAGRLGQA